MSVTIKRYLAATIITADEVASLKKYKDAENAELDLYFEAERDKKWPPPIEAWWRRFWENDTGVCSGEKTFIKAVHFPNGYEVDIKLCGCQDRAPWSEAVLFDENGTECCCSKPGNTSKMLYKWELEHEGIRYTAWLLPPITEGVDI